MAVAMEVASWRGTSELGGSSPGRKKRAWGADAQQLMQLMMGQQPPHSHSHSHPTQSELTLDLLGSADPTAAAATASPTTLPQLSPEFLHLDPEEDSLPLPSGWEKCLDLQTGKLYFVNKNSGVSSFDDPRKQTYGRDLYTVEIELQTEVASAAAAGAAHEAPLAHEFLGSKKSETESLKGVGCSSSSSGSPPRPQPRESSDVPSSSYSKQQWSLHQHRHRHYNNNNNNNGAGTTSGRDDSNLELDLNLAAGGNASSSRILHQLQQQQQEPQAVCTMEMIQNALRRTSERTTATTNTIKRESTVSRLRLKSSISSSFSSLTNCTTTTTRSEPSAASPSTSSSSSASSRSGAGGLRAPPSTTTGVCEAESLKVASVVEPGALVMGACTRCLMYVMLNKADPRCPRCDSKVPVEFAPPCKKQRPGLNLGFGYR